MKKETIEEAAAKYWQKSIDENRPAYIRYDAYYKEGFLDGANWQKEQLFNELIEAFKVEGVYYSKGFLLKLLEQNKKK